MKTQLNMAVSPVQFNYTQVYQVFSENINNVQVYQVCLAMGASLVVVLANLWRMQ